MPFSLIEHNMSSLKSGSHMLKNNEDKTTKTVLVAKK